MKTKIVKNIFVASLTMVTLFSCTKDFLEVQPKGIGLESTYYKNGDEAYSALIAVYDKMSLNSSAFDNIISFFNAGSDDNYGASAAGDAISLFSFYQLTPTNVPRGFWSNHYQGIFRANTLLEKLPGIPMDASLKARYTAECKAMRAYYHFNVLRIYGNVPLVMHTISPTEAKEYPQSNPKEVYAQIENDLREAIAALPVTIDVDKEGGRWTQGAAKAMLGKVYLYDKQYDKSAAILAEVNGTPGGTSQYGYKLLNNFSDLWKHSNKFNSESILEDVHTNLSKAAWGSGLDWFTEGSILNIMVGIRDYAKTPNSTAPDYFSGWGINTVTKDLYDVMKGDPRFSSTIIDANDLIAKGQIKQYTSTNEASTNTGYFMAKFATLKSDLSDAGGSKELNISQDTYIIRLADSYLMEAEALANLGQTTGRAKDLLDAVRARVGLPSVTVSLESIALERRKELACEGHRYFDLIRTGKAATVLASRGFKAGKNEILPIPIKELENTTLKQNLGY